jgi:hypothetical protein
MSESLTSRAVGGPCATSNIGDLELASLSTALANDNQSAIGHNHAPIYEDLNNYELEDEEDEPDLEENPDWSDEDTDEEDGEDEKDKQGGVELDLSSKRFSSASTPAPAKYTSSSINKSRPLPPIPIKKMPNPNVPKPGPAKLSKNASLAEWLEEAKQCHYLPEAVMKQLCEMVKECLMEGMSSRSLCDDLC